MLKISILVPVCNVEKFLEQCLNSIVNQTLKDIEIICINDGSKDKSLEIIEKFADVDSRIVIIDKSNSGYGDSMNKGLEIARGEYIGIVESDDFADLNMFEELYELAKKNDADIVKSNYKLYWGDQDKFVFFNNLKIKDVVTDSSNKDIVFYSASAIWSAIYKKDFLTSNSIEFLPTPGASYQDTSFKFKTTALANKISLTPKAYLNYRQDNVNSSVKIASKEKVLMVHKEYEEIKEFCKKNNLGIYLINYYVQKIDAYIWNYNRIDKNLKKWYFDVFAEEISKEGDKWNLYGEQLKRVLSRGAYEAIIKKDLKIYRLHRILERIKRSINKRVGLFTNID